MSILTQLTRKKLVVVFVGYCVATLAVAAMMYYLTSSTLSFLEHVGVYSPVGVFIALQDFYERERRNQKPIK